MQRTYQHPLQSWLNGQTGCQTSEKDVFKFCAAHHVVLLGESHDHADHHHWQLAAIKQLLNYREKIAVGFEMFPKHVQPHLDQWIKGSLTEEQFQENTDWKKVWGFDYSLYRPLFQYCKNRHLPMIALNCDRSLVSDIGKLGWDGIPKERYEDMTPAKPATAKYRRYLFDVTGGSRPDRKAKNAEDPAFDRFVRAQQVWDRAFSCTLAAFHQKSPGTLLVGIIGSGHLEYRGGTPFQLDDLGITKNAVLLPTDEPDTPKGIADFIYRLPVL